LCKEYYSGIKKQWNPIICSKIEGIGGHDVKWNKLDMVRKMPHVLSHMWVLKCWSKCRM
jgi:hypothetical protein